MWTVWSRSSSAVRTTRNSPRGRAGQLRIIAGRWRGRRIPFPVCAELRPTPDRVRETLFNWLAPVIQGAVCLDLYAGSGALGLEAASRGAAAVTLVETDPQAFGALERVRAELGAEGAKLVQADALDYVGTTPARFDVVFVDPPFQAGLLQESCVRIAAAGILRPGARIYLERPAGQRPPELPDGWTLVREKRAGRVVYGLAITGH